MHSVSKHMRILEPTTKIWMKIDLYCQRRRCSPMTIFSSNICLCGYSQGFLGDEASNNSGVIENIDFQGFRTLRLRRLRTWGLLSLFSPLSPFHWPQNTCPWMTLNGLNGDFTLNFHYYELLLSNYLLLIYCRVCLRLVLLMWPAEKCGKRSTGPWSAEYLKSAEKMRIFRRRYIVGILTNKANISNLVFSIT